MAPQTSRSETREKKVGTYFRRGGQALDELVVAARPRPRLRLRRLGEEIEGGRRIGEEQDGGGKESKP